MENLKNASTEDLNRIALEQSNETLEKASEFIGHLREKYADILDKKFSMEAGSLKIFFMPEGYREAKPGSGSEFPEIEKADEAKLSEIYNALGVVGDFGSRADLLTGYENQVSLGDWLNKFDYVLQNISSTEEITTE